MVKVLEAAECASAVYGDETVPKLGGWSRLNSRAPLNGLTGFFGSGFVSPLGDELVIAFRGSEGLGDDALRDWLINDVAILSKIIPIAQWAEAELFASNLMRQQKRWRQCFVVGHSLGGALAQIVAGNTTECFGVTFNAPGVRDHLFASSRAWRNAKSILNVRVKGDPVSAFGKHVGKQPITIGEAVGLQSAVAQIYRSCTQGLFIGLQTGHMGLAAATGVAYGAAQAGKIAASPHLMSAMITALGQAETVSSSTPQALLAR
jgi:hypothetical protein